MGPPFNIMGFVLFCFVALSYISGLLKCEPSNHCPLNKCIGTWYSASLSPDNGSLVCMEMGKLQLDQNSVHTNQDVFRTLTRWEGVNIINFLILHWLGHRLLWQLPWALFRMPRTCCFCINQVIVFQGQSSILGNFPSHLSISVASLTIHPVCCIYWRVRDHTWVRASASWLPVVTVSWART